MVKFIHREIETSIIDASKYFSVISVIGPRQSGKTTLIKNLFSTLPYYSLEDLDVRNVAKEDPRGFLAKFPNGAVLDEVHNAPELLSYIQGIVDNDESVRFVLSGSSQFSMLQSVTQSLAGRTAIFELMPFSYSELHDKLANKSLDTILYNGFYPAIHSGRNKAEYLYQSYVKTYLERDVRQLLNIGDMDAFQKFLRVCASRIGSIFKAVDIANEIGVSYKTIQSWMSVLQASYVIILLQPFSTNTEKRLTKSPKIYFVDTGLACYLLGIENESQLSRDRMRGNLFENFVVMEALKKRYNQGKESNLYFYRDSNQNEVDLLVKKANVYDAIEIKSSQTFHPEFEKGLKMFKQNFESHTANCSVIYTGDLEVDTKEIKLYNYKNLDKILR